MVEYVENHKYKSNYAIWPELVPNKINRKVENSWELSNPAYMKKTIEFFKVDEIGSNYPKEIFDPHNVALDKDDYFDGIVKKQIEFQPKAESKPTNPLSSIIPSNMYGLENHAGGSSIPIFHSAAALTGNNTYDDPKFLQFIAQREKEAKMSNSLKDEF